MNRLIVFVLLGSILLSSCNRKVGAIFGRKGDKLEVADPEFQYLSAKAKFKYDDGKKGISAIANFRIKKDSLIWMSITPGLGIEVARVLMNREQVFILDKINKQYYEYTFDELSKAYDFDFTFKIMQSVILGNLVEPYRRQKIDKSEDYFSYTASKGVYLFQNFIGSKSMKLEKVEVFDEETKNSISVNYSDFILVRGQVFPNEITAKIDYESATQANKEINISYSRMVIQEAPISFPYAVPSKYERK